MFKRNKNVRKAIILDDKQLKKVRGGNNVTNIDQNESAAIIIDDLTSF